MNNISKYYTNAIWIVLLSVALFQSSCKKSNEAGAPTIATIRAYQPSPNDTVLTKCQPGTWVVIQGSNLLGTLKVLFDGYSATFNSALLNNNSIVVQIPADLPFALVKPEQLNTITVKTNGGEVTQPFTIYAPAPVISAISNEMTNPGESVTITGSFLYLIKKIVFPGNLEITDFSGNPGGTMILAKIPQTLDVNQSGPITIQTEFGSSTSVFNINDLTTGMLFDFDKVNTDKSNSSMIENVSGDFPGNRGKYLHFAFTNVAAGAWAPSSGGEIDFGDIQWIDPSHLSDPASNWALKFEIYVKEPWSDGFIMFYNDWSWDNCYNLELAPWVSGSAFSTSGWVTISAPLSSIGKGWLQGAAVIVGATLNSGAKPSTVDAFINGSSTVGTNGLKFLGIAYHSPNKAVAKFDAAIDNIRLVKIN